VKGGDRERKAILEEVQRILEMVLSRVKLGSAGEEMGWKETSTPPLELGRCILDLQTSRDLLRDRVWRRGFNNPDRLPLLR